MINKRGKAWVWILIVIILIALGIGLYFLLSGDSSPGSSLGVGGIPSPLVLPE